MPSGRCPARATPPRATCSPSTVPVDDTTVRRRCSPLRCPTRWPCTRPARHRRRPHRGALVVLAAKAGIDADRARAGSASVRCRSTRPQVHGHLPLVGPRGPNSDVLVCVKGAPDVLLGGAPRRRRRRRRVADRRHGPRGSTADNDRLPPRACGCWPSPPALRLRRAGRRHRRRPRPLDRPSSTLEVLVGIVDPPRPEARDAIAPVPLGRASP